ncbi:hypothetical protein [Haloarcula brevis]|uniref:hypothetical protein n=1 Tax=Haloarcula brevis TaxID=3111453 RepID=UPI00300EA1A5
MRVVNLIYYLPDGNTVSEIMDERSDIMSKEREMANDAGENGGNAELEPVVVA